MTIKEWLDSLKAGDQVVRVTRGFGVVRTLETIQSILGTERRVIILAGGERFNGTTGRKQQKSGAWDSFSGTPVIMEATPELKAGFAPPLLPF